MAYTITETAPTYANAHNDVIFSVYDNVRSNNQTTYPDFTYICDVYVDSVMVARLKAIPDPTYFAGVFNIKRILQDYMAAVEISTPSEDSISLEFFANRLSYQLKFGSEYGSTLTTNEIVDSSRYVYNSYDKYGDSNGGANLYTTSAGFKTDRPARVTINDTRYAGFIPFYNQSSGTVTVVAKTHTSSGSVIDSLNVLIAASGMCTLNASDHAIGSDMNTTNAAASSFTYDGQTYYFDWACNPKFQTYSVGFLNRYGGFETYDFMKASSLPIQITRKQIESMYYSAGVSGVITYGNQIGKIRNFSNKVDRKVKLKSDWITDETYVWLEQLIISPQLYIFDLGYGKWVKVSLTNTDYEPKQFVKDGLTILELEFEFDGYSPQRL